MKVRQSKGLIPDETRHFQEGYDSGVLELELQNAV